MDNNFDFVYISIKMYHILSIQPIQQFKYHRLFEVEFLILYF